jgi:methionyl aminopeptidase
VIILKSSDELEKMRKAGRIVADTIGRVLDAVAPGVSTADLDHVAESAIAEMGAIPSFKGYRGASQAPFPATICASPDRRLREGDLLSLDFGAIWEGFHSDSALTVFVGMAPSAEAERLVKTTEAALDAAIAEVLPGGRLSDIGHAIETVASREGLGIVREYGGHGIGRAMHEDPFIQNWGKPDRGPELRPGLVIAVEPMLNLGEDQTAIMPDGWTVVTADGSLSAHFEHTVAVTREGHEVLTARD